jgi:uncharacterized small protein (DUF1192 family)
MPLKLSALVANTASVHLDFGAMGDLTVRYRPALINERTLAMLSVGEMNDGAALAEMMARFNAELCRLIVGWDLTDDAGAAIPLTPDALSALPLTLRVSVLSEIASDLRLGEASGSAPSAP